MDTYVVFDELPEGQRMLLPFHNYSLFLELIYAKFLQEEDIIPAHGEQKQKC